MTRTTPKLPAQTLAQLAQSLGITVVRKAGPDTRVVNELSSDAVEVAVITTRDPHAQFLSVILADGSEARVRKNRLVVFEDPQAKTRMRVMTTAAAVRGEDVAAVVTTSVAPRALRAQTPAQAALLAGVGGGVVATEFREVSGRIASGATRGTTASARAKLPSTPASLDPAAGYVEVVKDAAASLTQSVRGVVDAVYAAGASAARGAGSMAWGAASAATTAGSAVLDRVRGAVPSTAQVATTFGQMTGAALAAAVPLAAVALSSRVEAASTAKPGSRPRKAKPSPVATLSGGPENPEATRQLVAALETTGDGPVISRALNAGANINAKNSKGATALISFSNNPNTYHVVLSLSAVEGIDINAKTKSGITALMAAAAKGYDKNVDALLRAGADPNVAGRSGETALLLTVAKGHASIVNALLSAGANPNVIGWSRESALLLAVASINVEIVKILLSHPNLNLTDKDLAAVLDLESPELTAALLSRHPATDSYHASDRFSTSNLPRSMLPVVKAMGKIHGCVPEFQMWDPASGGLVPAPTYSEGDRSPVLVTVRMGGKTDEKVTRSAIIVGCTQDELCDQLRFAMQVQPSGRKYPIAVIWRVDITVAEHDDGLIRKQSQHRGSF